jgi:hypothetical protein
VLIRVFTEEQVKPTKPAKCEQHAETPNPGIFVMRQCWGKHCKGERITN